MSVDSVLDNVRRELERRLTKAAIIAETRSKQLISRGQPTKRDASGRRVGLDPSKPGEPPKVITGALRSNVSHEVKATRRQVTAAIGVRKGAADKYARRLELGFVGTDKAGRNVNQPPRPYLRPGILLSTEQIRDAMRGK